jgi:hypothetical protein
MSISLAIPSRFKSSSIICKSSTYGSICALFVGLLANLLSSAAVANPWAPMTSASPFPNRYVPPADTVPGKDFSDVRDRDAAGVPDPEQDVAWDGLGGVRDSLDYSGSRLAYPDVLPDREVDGISAGGDALFQALRDNQAALLFSVETDPNIMFERETGLPNSPPGFGVWATATDLDAMNPPLDTDGLEVWGGDNSDDSDRYSLAGDPFTDFVVPNESRKVAIWQYIGGTSTHHTLTTDLASAMDLQFAGIGMGGPYWGQLVELMDVDAIMTFGTQVTFSIRPISFEVPGPAGPILVTFDGGEIFEYDDASTATRFLDHGGHLWDTAFDVMGTFNLAHENIDAIEAVSALPEPSCGTMLLVLGLLLAPRLARHRR